MESESLFAPHAVCTSVCTDALLRVPSSACPHTQAEQTSHTTLLGTFFSGEENKQNTHPVKTACQPCMDTGAGKAAVLRATGSTTGPESCSKAAVNTLPTFNPHYTADLVLLKFQGEASAYASWNRIVCHNRQTTVYIKDVTTASCFSSEMFHFP